MTSVQIVPNQKWYHAAERLQISPVQNCQESENQSKSNALLYWSIFVFIFIVFLTISMLIVIILLPMIVSVNGGFRVSGLTVFLESLGHISRLSTNPYIAKFHKFNFD